MKESSSALTKNPPPMIPQNRIGKRIVKLADGHASKNIPCDQGA